MPEKTRGTPLIELETWRLFISAMDTGSLLQSARSEGLDPSTLSRRLKALESQLSAQLFYRDNTGVYPTVTGQALLERIRPVMDRIEAVQTDVSHRKARFQGRYRVFLPHDLASPEFLSFFYRLALENPELSFSFAVGRAPADCGVVPDLLFRCAPGAEAGYEETGKIATGLFASPDYLQHEGVPGSPEELLSHALLVPKSLSERQRTVFTQGESKVSIPLTWAAFFPNSGEAAAAAATGEGIAAGIPAFSSLTAAAGLVQVLPDWEMPEVRVSLRVQGALQGSFFASYLMTRLREALTQAGLRAEKRAPRPQARRGEGLMPKTEDHTRAWTLAFLDILRFGGLGRAARARGVSVPQMSRELGLLEKKLGVALVVRYPQGVRATAEGAAYSERMAPLLEELAGIERTVIQSRKMTARLLLPPAAGTQLFPAWIAEFQRLHPGAVLSYDLEGSEPAFRGGFDFKIDVSREPREETMVALRVGEVPLVNAASPDYISSAGDLFEPQTLQWHKLWYAPSETETPLELRNGAAACQLDLSRASASPGLLVLLNTIRAGSGIGLALPRWLVEKDLASGRLIEVLPQWKLPPTMIWFLRPPSRFPSLLAQQLVAFFRGKAKDIGL